MISFIKLNEVCELPNYLEYQKSIAAEFKAYEKRVRNLIDATHWGEEGRYKEIILMNYLKRVLPQNLSVGTGFVRNRDEITSQIDIIIYDNSFPVLFSEGDFVITTPDNVVGIVEVKSNISSGNFLKILEKSNRNGSIIVGKSDRYIFNGIFSYNIRNGYHNYIDKLEENDFLSKLILRPSFQRTSQEAYTLVNHITLGDEYFVKLWEGELSHLELQSPYYNFYELPNRLAFSYFLSNLQDSIIRKAKGTSIQNKDIESFYYPLPDGKEAFCLRSIRVG